MKSIFSIAVICVAFGGATFAHALDATSKDPKFKSCMKSGFTDKECASINIELPKGSVAQGEFCIKIKFRNKACENAPVGFPGKYGSPESLKAIEAFCVDIENRHDICKKADQAVSAADYVLKALEAYSQTPEGKRIADLTKQNSESLKRYYEEIYKRTDQDANARPMVVPGH